MRKPKRNDLKIGKYLSLYFKSIERLNEGFAAWVEYLGRKTNFYKVKLKMKVSFNPSNYIGMNLTHPEWKPVREK